MDEKFPGNYSPCFRSLLAGGLKKHTPLKTNISPEKWWFPIGISFSRGSFSGAMLVSGSVISFFSPPPKQKAEKVRCDVFAHIFFRGEGNKNHQLRIGVFITLLLNVLFWLKHRGEKKPFPTSYYDKWGETPGWKKNPSLPVIIINGVKLTPYKDAGWWFQIFFIFTPIWGRFPIWRAYFSNGLVQPPTRMVFIIQKKPTSQHLPKGAVWTLRDGL